MARRKPSTDEWKSIFNDLVLETEPPMEYVKSVTITTKTGGKFNITPEEFESVMEREKLLSPDSSLIASCKLALNIPKIKRDVNKWTDTMLDSFDKTGKAPMPTFTKETKSKS